MTRDPNQADGMIDSIEHSEQIIFRLGNKLLGVLGSNSDLAAFLTSCKLGIIQVFHNRAIPTILHLLQFSKFLNVFVHNHKQGIIKHAVESWLYNEKVSK